MARRGGDAPCVAEKLTALVGAEDEEDVRGGAERTVEDAFVVRLRCPEARLHAQVKAVLQRNALVSTR
jgi:hypothetical protein